MTSIKSSGETFQQIFSDRKLGGRVTYHESRESTSGLTAISLIITKGCNVA